MTHCRVCSCKLKTGDICRRCEYEQNWLSTPEYFCTSSNCQKLLPGATEPGLCDACKKLAKIPYKPLQKPIKIEIKPETQEEIMLTQKSKERCKVCDHRLTKNGHCLSCARRGNKNRAKGKTYPAPPAPKTGAEKSMCNETAPKVTQENSNVAFEPAANTIHASPPPTQVVKINELDVCRRVINQHGISRQLAKAAEEFSEAAAAISRFLAGEGEYTEIIGEVADVEVMCVQMRLIYGADAIDQVRAEKVARLHGRLNNGRG